MDGRVGSDRSATDGGAGRQRVRFPKPHPARYVKLETLSEVKGEAFTSVAEVDLLIPGDR